ncbi:MAG TPA: hypothetical protein VJN94_03075 [Candidatus Binataceae bacterium]|nr:hypothetical protein [Candidatus Binataceae bacterium]
MNDRGGRLDQSLQKDLCFAFRHLPEVFPDFMGLEERSLIEKLDSSRKPGIIEDVVHLDRGRRASEAELRRLSLKGTNLQS